MNDRPPTPVLPYQTPSGQPRHTRRTLIILVLFLVIVPSAAFICGHLAGVLLPALHVERVPATPPHRDPVRSVINPPIILPVRRPCPAIEGACCSAQLTRLHARCLCSSRPAPPPRLQQSAPVAERNSGSSDSRHAPAGNQADRRRSQGRRWHGQRLHCSRHPTGHSPVPKTHCGLPPRACDCQCAPAVLNRCNHRRPPGGRCDPDCFCALAPPQA